MFNLDDYETVEERLAKFWKDNPDGRIETKLLENSASRFIVWSAVYRHRDDTHPWATGLAEETVQGRGVNATSALENCETSSIGRSLANCGYAAKGKRPSAEEMAKVKAKADATAIIQETKEKMTKSSGTYVPVPNPDDPWTVVPTQQGQTLGEAVEVLKETGFATLNAPPVMQCKCGKDARWVTGEKRDGSPWGHYKCTNVPSRKCMDPVWYNLKNGQWVKQ